MTHNDIDIKISMTIKTFVPSFWMFPTITFLNIIVNNFIPTYYLYIIGTGIISIKNQFLYISKLTYTYLNFKLKSKQFV